MRADSAAHECRFVEEQEPSGRLILGPCLICGVAAMDAMGQLRDDLKRAEMRLRRQVEFHQHFRARAISAEQALGLYGKANANA